MKRRIFSFGLIILIGSCSFAFAALTNLVIEKRSNLPGDYELLEGHFTGAIDPSNPHNVLINDISLAPRNAQGGVEYWATFAIAKPKDMAKASGVMIYDVPNRGRGSATALSDGSIDVISGWQGDLPDAPGRQLIHVPQAPLLGPVAVRFIDMPPGVSTLAIKGGPLGAIGGRNFEPATEEGAKLFIGHSDDAPLDQTEVAKSEWAFGDCTSRPFPGKPDLTKLCIKQGFDPRLAYTLTFQAKNPSLLGLGFAATRDLIAFLRYDNADAAGTPNPLAGKIRWAIGRGVSQSGNFLRAFVDLDMNMAENGRIIFEGINPIVAMRMNSMNYRFAVPGGLVGLYEAGNDGFNWWSDYEDRERGLPKGGLFTRCRSSNSCPKVMEIMGSAEFWNLRASINFVGSDLKGDIALPTNVRRYYNAGVTHNGGTGGFERISRSVPGCVLAANSNPTSDTNRALFQALIEWVTKGSEPPASSYPTLVNGDLITPSAYEAHFPLIAGVPRAAINPLPQYDYGTGFDYADVSGAMSLVPPHIIRMIPQLVPRTDKDGNELSGIRSVLMQAPLGTYVGWNVAAQGFQKGRYCGNAGGYIPFAATRLERMADGDPRASLEERYPTHAAYVEKVKAAADALVAQRYLLVRDRDRLISEAQASDIGGR